MGVRIYIIRHAAAYKIIIFRIFNMHKRKKIIVIKIGSSVIFTRRNKIDEFRLVHIAAQILSLQSYGFGVILVISGAVACGIFTTNKSDSIQMWGNNIIKRAAAGIGQTYLISALLRIFGQKNLKIAQVLLTRDNLNSQRARNNLLETLDFYTESGIVPIFNENDVVDLNSFGGNDYLAFEVTKLITANKLIILSTLEGSVFGVGGGKAKLEVVSLLKKDNIMTLIVDGKQKNIIEESCL